MVSGDERINKSNHKGTKKSHSKNFPMYLFHHSIGVTHYFRLVISFILSALYGYIVGAVKFKWSHSFGYKCAFVFGAEFKLSFINNHLFIHIKHI